MRIKILNFLQCIQFPSLNSIFSIRQPHLKISVFKPHNRCLTSYISFIFLIQSGGRKGERNIWMKGIKRGFEGVTLCKTGAVICVLSFPIAIGLYCFGKHRLTCLVSSGFYVTFDSPELHSEISNA